MGCYHPDKLGDHRYCDNGDTFLICCVTSRDHMAKMLCNFMGGCSSILEATINTLSNKQ